MQNLRKLSGLALVVLGGAPCAAWAQAVVPAVPAAAVAPAPAVAAAPAAAAAAAPTKNLWTFLCPTPAQKAACKAKFCGSQFGQLINNSLAPMAAFSGGVIPQCCPLIDPAGLGMDPTSPQGAAAQIQKDTAEAAARRAAIRYMSTVDCNWWPEATAALSGALRADRNECVRLEAGLALQRGCCCNRITIKALVDSLSVFPDDGNPPEDSPRVRAAAMGALQHCLACYVALKPVPPPPPGSSLRLKEALPPGEAPPLKGPPLTPVPAVPVPAVPTQASGGTASVAEAQNGLRPAAYRAPAQEKGMEQLVQEARVVLQQAQQRQALQRRGNLVGTSQRPVDHSLIEVIDNALRPPTPPQPAKNTHATCPPEGACEQGDTVPPPVLKPVPQVAPLPSPQTRVLPVAYPPSPVPLAPQPSAPRLTTANSSYVPISPPVPATAPQPVAPPVRSTTAPPINGASAPSIVSKPSESYVRTTAPQSSSPAPKVVRPFVAPSTEASASSGPKVAPVISTSSRPVTPPTRSAATQLAISKPAEPHAEATAPLVVRPAAKQKETTGSASVKTIAVKPAESARSQSADISARKSPPPLPAVPSPIHVSPAVNLPSAVSTAPVVTAPTPPLSPPVSSPRTPVRPDAPPRPTVVESVVPSRNASVPSTASVPSALPASAGAGQTPTVSQLLVLLMSSDSPNTRQWAAQSLSAHGEQTPTVVHALVNGAAEDASVNVRDACLQSLLQLGVRDPITLAKADWPLIDGDPRVREAVWRHVLYGTESRGNSRVRDGAKALNQWFQNRPTAVRPARS